MKKIILVCLIAALAMGAVFAQDAGTISAGAHLGILPFGFNAQNPFPATEFPTIPNTTVTRDAPFGFMGGAFGSYTIIDNFSVQLEINVMAGLGSKTTSKTGDVTTVIETTYTAIDIPILAKYSFMSDPLIVGGMAGPYLSLPLGKTKVTRTISGASTGNGTTDITPKFDTDDNGNLTGLGIGALLGVYVGYPLGPGMIVGDVRFMFDFTGPWYKYYDTEKNRLKADSKAEDHWLVKRLGFAINVGYQMSF